MDEYIIINKTATQKRIEELEKQFKTPHIGNINRVEELKQILSQSTPLIPIVEKAFDASKITNGMNQRNQFAYKYKNSQDYISNLKLDI